MTKSPGPLNWNTAIVDSRGNPTPEFLQKWNNQARVNGAIPALSTPPQVSAVLDVLSAVPNSLLLRGASQWGPLTAPNDATKFLNGAFAPAWAQVKDSDLSTSDTTSNNVSITKHGFAPKAPNDVTKFLNGLGAYSAPASGGGGGLIDMSAGVPLVSTFSLINAGSATAVDSSPANKAIIITAPQVTGNNAVILTKAKPATPYRVAAMIQPASIGTNTSTLSFISYLGFRNTTTGRFEGVGFGTINNSNRPFLDVDNFTSPTLYNATLFASGAFIPGGDFLLGIRDDGTNHFYEYSADGVQWITLFTAANSGWWVNSSSTYDAVGIDVNNNVAQVAKVTLRLWDVNALTRNYP